MIKNFDMLISLSKWIMELPSLDIPLSNAFSAICKDSVIQKIPINVFLLSTTVI